jgi:hypothetical protein
MSQRVANGPAAAAILAAGIGCFVFGLLTVLEHTSVPTSQTLTLYVPVGSHSGTTAVGTLLWLGGWLVLHQRWKTAQVNFQRIFLGAFILIALGGIGTFPPFYEAVGRAEAAILDGR